MVPTRHRGRRSTSATGNDVIKSDVVNLKVNFGNGNDVVLHAGAGKHHQPGQRPQQDRDLRRHPRQQRRCQ